MKWLERLEARLAAKVDTHDERRVTIEAYITRADGTKEHHVLQEGPMYLAPGAASALEQEAIREDE